MSESDDRIKADILNKLCRKRKWGASHTPLTNLHKWCPRHLAKKYPKVAEALIHDGLLLQKPTHYGVEVSMNPQRKGEISRIIITAFGKEQGGLYMS